MRQVHFSFDAGYVHDILQAGGRDALFAAAHDLANESTKQVPLDEATLLHSLAVDVEDDMAVISYDTPYAVRMHEHPEYHFQRGRKGKYLEDPVNNRENWTRLLRYLADNMKL